MAHQLVQQLRFAKQQWLEGHDGLTSADAEKRIGRSNSISWMVAHLADFDQAIWIEQRGGLPTVNHAVKQCGYGMPASTPNYEATLEAWHAIQARLNPLIELVSAEQLAKPHGTNRTPAHENLGTLLLRQTWHYWYHLGEMQLIRQALGHENLPQFVNTIPPMMAWFPD